MSSSKTELPARAPACGLGGALGLVSLRYLEPREERGFWGRDVGSTLSFTPARFSKKPKSVLR